MTTRTTADALDACIRLMLRATPHPDDRDLWHDTLREASKALDRDPSPPEFDRLPTPPRLWWLAALAVVALAYVLFLKG